MERSPSTSAKPHASETSDPRIGSHTRPGESAPAGFHWRDLILLAATCLLVLGVSASLISGITGSRDAVAPQVPAQAPVAIAIDVAGQVRLNGGPKGTSPIGVQAALRAVLLQHGGLVMSVEGATDVHGHFTLALTPGVWTIHAVSPRYLDGAAECVARVEVPTANPVFVECPIR